MATETSKIAKDILKLNKNSSYKKFPEGFFVNVPKLEGYIFTFSNLKDPKVYIIVNTNKKFTYSKKYIKINNHHFIVYNGTSIEEFTSNILNNLSNIIQILKNITKESAESATQKEGGLPYGYYEDKNGDIQVDTKEAAEVRQIFKAYSNIRSVKKTAQQLGTNFSHVRDVLRDERYSKMSNIIIPQNDLKRVREILAVNRKNKNVK